MKKQQAITWIASLPPMPEWYAPEAAEIAAEIDDLRRHYRYLARWLKHLMEEQPEPDYVADQDLLTAFSSARYWQFFYDLITATKLALKDVCPFWKQADRAGLWVACIISDSLWILEQKGVRGLVETGVATPKITSKSDLVEYQAEALRRYNVDKTHESEQVTFSNKTGLESLYIRPWVEGQALRVAKVNREFKRLYWNPYLELWRGLNDEIRSDDSIQLSYLLPDGKRLVTGKHVKLPHGFDSEIRTPIAKKRKKRAKAKRMEMLQKVYING